jgi:hypothetical protein
MDVVEPVKRIAEMVTGVGLPSREEAAACVVDRRPALMKFRDDGYIPNNPKYPSPLGRQSRLVRDGSDRAPYRGRHAEARWPMPHFRGVLRLRPGRESSKNGFN